MIAGVAISMPRKVAVPLVTVLIAPLTATWRPFRSGLAASFVEAGRVTRKPVTSCSEVATTLVPRSNSNPMAAAVRVEELPKSARINEPLTHSVSRAKSRYVPAADGEIVIAEVYPAVTIAVKLLEVIEPSFI